MTTNINTAIHSMTTASGSASVNTTDRKGILRQVLISPASASTDYDIKLTNDQSLIIYLRTTETGDLAEEVALPVLGIYTINIDNATKDEVFKVELVIQA